MPTEERREKRRKSVQGHIIEHTMGLDGAEEIGPLEYWGSLLSVEVKAYEARIEDIEAERETLDIEELKGHILDIHGPNRSRPSSSYETERSQYLPLDDFSILVTQTLLQALPYLSKLKLSIDTWSTRLTILFNAPKFLSDLRSTRKALDLAWRALEPPSDVDTSDNSFSDWKTTITDIMEELRIIISGLGQRLDRMLDILEGREDALPDIWIEDFEELESDYSHWTVESRNRILEVEVRRIKAMRRAIAATTVDGVQPDPRVESGAPRNTENGHRNSANDALGQSENASGVGLSNQKGDLAVQYEPFPDLVPANGIAQASPQSPSTLRLAIPSPNASQHRRSKSNNTTFSLDSEGDSPDDAVEGDSTDDVVEGAADGGDPVSTEDRDEPIVHTRPNLTMLKRASVTSIESFSRAQVRTLKTFTGSVLTIHRLKASMSDGAVVLLYRLLCKIGLLITGTIIVRPCRQSPAIVPIPRYRANYLARLLRRWSHLRKSLKMQAPGLKHRLWGFVETVLTLPLRAYRYTQALQAPLTIRHL
jgi:hypothetical protein